MKKMVVFLLVAAVGISLVLSSCGGKGKKETNSEDDNKIVGGWTVPDSPVVSKEVQAVLEKATAELTGGTYAPVAYLGSQVVAGTNYRILCKFTPATPDAEANYAIVTVYEDLEGKAEITEILNSEAKVPETDVMIDGGWIAPETPELTTEAFNALKASSEAVVGAAYAPVVLLGTQVVAGMNYCMLCEITPVTENAESHYAVVVVYEGVDGNTSVIETYDFTADAAE